MVLLFESCLSICKSHFNFLKFVGWGGSDSFNYFTFDNIFKDFLILSIFDDGISSGVNIYGVSVLTDW